MNTTARRHALAAKCNDAYSSDRYRNGWLPCVGALLARGLSEREIEAILRSKYTRWAADTGGKRYGHATAKDLIAYIDAHLSAEDLAQLVEETFDDAA